MATLTNEQIEQKKQLLAEKMKEVKAIYDELVEAGVIELSDEELDSVTGGKSFSDWFGGIIFSDGVQKMAHKVRSIFE
ncbi:MAG: hypothetical protein IJR07_00215 [Bacteroidaceae bacterium]|nr:hypothetical protein [Bacteroidaceae bacterium]